MEKDRAYLEVEPHLLLGPVGGISPRVPAQRPQGHRYFFSEVFLQGQEVGGIEGGAGHLETALGACHRRASPSATGPPAISAPGGF